MTQIAVHVDGGRARCALRTGLLSPRVLSSDHAGARVALVATGALLLAGDHVRIDVRVGPGAWLEVVETSGTVAYDARGGAAAWDVTIHVDEGGTLVWEGLPFVVASGADVTRRTTATLAHGAVLLLRETLVLGRTGEIGGDLRSQTRCSLDGQPAFVEDLRLDVSRTAPGVLGDARVLDSALCIGTRPPPSEPVAGQVHLDLDAPGAVLRSVGQHAHTGSVGARWARWTEHVRHRPPPLLPSPLRLASDPKEPHHARS
ncbi:urease accessory protein UreD [Sanguibacter antarcticus]|uniref:Urease accessory protein n=1 Tax=Sanguibacter antarcticus TaxID=372484 RepID=A0A2A9DZG5_9MICO|nr:urease accessory protein UreD [Sanguibacter antarcticus]PFG32197.1 urease accessory protein [Sanguibacter antarcticus]PFG35315.1 urease accessory protein [Sanguibacter antarcticus]